MSKTQVLQGDCMAVLPTLPADHFHVCCTSPPYFALRSYLKADDPLKPLEIGSEKSPEEFIETMVKVFAEVKRVLHPTGLLFLNLGDSYGGQTCRKGHNWLTRSGEKQADLDAQRYNTKIPGEPGQLLNMPHRVAEALRADGWHWRQTIIFGKKSPMPESCKGWRWERCRVKVTPSEQPGPVGGAHQHGRNRNIPGAHASVSTPANAVYEPCPGCAKCSPHGGYVLRKGKGRCTTAHEYIFVMSKTPEYFWDSAAFVEESSGLSGGACIGKVGSNGPGSRRVSEEENAAIRGNTRNPRSVWTLSSEPVSIPHFATYPSELVRRCIQAGTSDGGACAECSEPWAPVVESKTDARTPYATTGTGDWAQGAGRRDGSRSVQKVLREDGAGGDLPKLETTILGYRPTCEHYTADALRQAATLPRTKQARKRYQQDAAKSWLVRALREAWRTAEEWVSADKRTPCRVLDPFAGIGTTLQSAQWMKREGVGIELNPEYIAHAEQRIDEPPRWWKRKHNAKPRPADLPGQRMLF